MTAVFFEHWVQNTLIPAVEKGDTIIMDNASFHRKEQLEKICTASGIGLLFLSSYSPDLNPIEKGWANMKRALRNSAPLFALIQIAIYHYWC